MSPFSNPPEKHTQKITKNSNVYVIFLGMADLITVKNLNEPKMWKLNDGRHHDKSALEPSSHMY